MVTISNSFRQEYANLVKRARAERIRCVRLRPRLYYVARKSAGHGEYLVEFFIIPSVNGEELVKAGCISVQGQRCRGTFSDRPCTHICVALLRALRHGRELERRESRAA